MERFTLNSKVACEQATESITNVKAKYTALLEYFGEDEQMATGDFFGTLRRFMVEWKKQQNKSKLSTTQRYAVNRHLTQRICSCRYQVTSLSPRVCISGQREEAGHSQSCQSREKGKQVERQEQQQVRRSWWYGKNSCSCCIIQENEFRKW
jgi:hypothetical protein